MEVCKKLNVLLLPGLRFSLFFFFHLSQWTYWVFRAHSWCTQYNCFRCTSNHPNAKISKCKRIKSPATDSIFRRRVIQENRGRNCFLLPLTSLPAEHKLSHYVVIHNTITKTDGTGILYTDWEVVISRNCEGIFLVPCHGFKQLGWSPLLLFWSLFISGCHWGIPLTSLTQNP